MTHRKLSPETYQKAFSLYEEGYSMKNVIHYDFDRACLPGDMARACSLSSISLPRASTRCKISIIDVF